MFDKKQDSIKVADVFEGSGRTRLDTRSAAISGGSGCLTLPNGIWFSFRFGSADADLSGRGGASWQLT